MKDKFMKNGVFSLEYDKETLKDMVLELQEENRKQKERIEYLERSNNRREDIILEQRQKISNLEDSWNKLKEYCEEVISTDNELYGTDLLGKMQELERSDSNDSNR